MLPTTLPPFCHFALLDDLIFRMPLIEDLVEGGKPDVHRVLAQHPPSVKNRQSHEYALQATTSSADMAYCSCYGIAASQQDPDQNPVQ